MRRDGVYVNKMLVIGVQSARVKPGQVRNQIILERSKSKFTYPLEGIRYDRRERLSTDFARLLRPLRVYLTHFQRTAERSIALQLATGLSNGCTSTDHESRMTDTS